MKAIGSNSACLLFQTSDYRKLQEPILTTKVNGTLAHSVDALPMLIPDSCAVDTRLRPHGNAKLDTGSSRVRQESKRVETGAENIGGGNAKPFVQDGGID